MNRQAKRKINRDLDRIVRHAKEDMVEYLNQVKETTPDNMKAWKAGYIAGINRGKSWNTSD